jgi:hypothetical protein
VAEVGEVYRRARELCKQLGETDRMIRVLFDLSSFHLVRAELQVSHSHTEEMCSLPFDFARREDGSCRMVSRGTEVLYR